MKAFEAAVRLKPDFSEAKAKLTALVKEARRTLATPDRGAIVGEVTVVNQYPGVYGKVLLTFTVQPDGWELPVSVEMRGRRRGAPLEKGDIVELRGRPRDGLLETNQIRNLSRGGAAVYVTGAGCFGTAVLLLGAFGGLDYLIFRTVFG
jgi:hypothetical protein